ncbi:unnamed protein product [Urochloa humidicola]
MRLRKLLGRKSIKDHAEASEQIMCNIDISMSIDLLKISHASEVRNVKWQIQNLDHELVRTQDDRDSWMNGGFRLQEENKQLVAALKCPRCVMKSWRLRRLWSWIPLTQSRMESNDHLWIVSEVSLRSFLLMCIVLVVL